MGMLYFEWVWAGFGLRTDFAPGTVTIELLGSLGGKINDRLRPWLSTSLMENDGPDPREFPGYRGVRRGNAGFITVVDAVNLSTTYDGEQVADPASYSRAHGLTMTNKKYRCKAEQ